VIVAVPMVVLLIVMNGHENKSRINQSFMILVGFIFIILLFIVVLMIL
jgi:hypothetical protein